MIDVAVPFRCSSFYNQASDQTCQNNRFLPWLSALDLLQILALSAAHGPPEFSLETAKRPVYSVCTKFTI